MNLDYITQDQSQPYRDNSYSIVCQTKCFKVLPNFWFVLESGTITPPYRNTAFARALIA